jgi:hypothetical protein
LFGIHVPIVDDAIEIAEDAMGGAVDLIEGVPVVGGVIQGVVQIDDNLIDTAVSIAPSFDEIIEQTVKLVEAAEGAVTGALGTFESWIFGTVGFHLDLTVLNRDSAFNTDGPMQRGWGARGGQELPLSGMRAELHRWGNLLVPTMFDGTVTDSGHINIEAAKGDCGVERDVFPMHAEIKRHSHARAVHWVAVAVSLACGSGCAPTPGPCLSWLTPGESYQATIGSLDPIARPLLSVDPKSCGADVDLQAGDLLTFDTESQEPRSPTCDFVRATAVSGVRNVMLGEAGEIAPADIRPDLEGDFAEATIGEKCHGFYRIGVNDLDRVRAYRTFRASNPEECAAEGVNVSADDPFCWDSWRVEVKNSKGVVVASSLE